MYDFAGNNSACHVSEFVSVSKSVYVYLCFQEQDLSRGCVLLYFFVHVCIYLCICVLQK